MQQLQSFLREVITAFIALVIVIWTMILLTNSLDGFGEDNIKY